MAHGFAHRFVGGVFSQHRNRLGLLSSIWNQCQLVLLLCGSGRAQSKTQERRCSHRIGRCGDNSKSVACSVCFQTKWRLRESEIMNAHPEFFELTWLDLLMEAGTPGLVAFWITVFLTAVGLFGLRRRFRAAGCQAYTVLALLPMVTGFYGACHLPVVFRTESGHFQSETLACFFSSGEVAMPVMVGSFGSCALMFIASILWMRCKEEPTDS